MHRDNDQDIVTWWNGYNKILHVVEICF